MVYIFNLAFRNILRNRRRTLLAIVSVGLSLLMIVLLQAWINGIMGSLVKNYTKNETGHIRIATKAFEEKYRFMPVNSYIRNPQEIIAKILSDSLLVKEINIITERTNFGALLSNNANNKSALIMAGDPSQESQLLYLQRSILPGGQYLQASNQAIIGKGIATKLGLKTGDTIRVMTQGSDYALHLKKLSIVGLFSTGVNQLDNNVVQMSINDARSLLALGKGTQQIVVMLHDYRRSNEVADLIRARIGTEDLSVTPWTRIGDYYNLVLTGHKIYNIIYLIIALLGAFIISNIMMMVVMERRHEIGILKSMGLRRVEILQLFLTEGLFLGLAGSAAGIFLGILIVLPLSYTGIDISPIMNSMNFPVDNVVHPALDIASVIKATLIGTILSGLVSLQPSYRAAKLNAIEAIKSV